MPRRHQEYADWSPERLIRWAAKSGPATKKLISTILESRPYPQQSYNTCFGIMRLGKSYGDQRLEAACARAISIGTCSYRSLESILKTSLDKQPLQSPANASKTVKHSNIREPSYFH